MQRGRSLSSLLLETKAQFKHNPLQLALDSFSNAFQLSHAEITTKTRFHMFFSFLFHLSCWIFSNVTSGLLLTFTVSSVFIQLIWVPLCPPFRYLSDMFTTDFLHMIFKVLTQYYVFNSCKYNYKRVTYSTLEFTKCLKVSIHYLI